MASSRFLLSAIAIALMVAGAAAQGKNLGEPRERVGGRQERERGEKLLAAAAAATLFFAGYIPLGFVSAGEIKKYSLFALSLPPFNNFPSDMQAADARSECTVIAARMQTGPCAKLQDATMVSRWRFLREREVSPLGSFFRRRRRCFFFPLSRSFLFLVLLLLPLSLVPPCPRKQKTTRLPLFRPPSFLPFKTPPHRPWKDSRENVPRPSHTPFAFLSPLALPKTKKTRPPPTPNNQPTEKNPPTKNTTETHRRDRGHGLPGPQRLQGDHAHRR